MCCLPVIQVTLLLNVWCGLPTMSVPWFTSLCWFRVIPMSFVFLIAHETELNNILKQRYRLANVHIWFIAAMTFIKHTMSPRYQDAILSIRYPIA